MKKIYLTLAILSIVQTSNIVSETLKFTIYNNSKTENYQVSITAFQASTKISKSQDKRTTTTLKPGKSYSYSKFIPNYFVGLKNITVTNSEDLDKADKDPSKRVASFKRTRKDDYKADKVTITENSDGFPDLSVKTGHAIQWM